MPRQRWEYTVLTYQTGGVGWIEGFVDGLDKEGLDGWEAVSVVKDDEGTAHLLMKRPK
jgi:hypothetical protein